MSTDENLKQQLADYFVWLEDHLGSDFRPSTASDVRGRWRRSGRALLVVVGVGSVVALIAVTVSRDSQNKATVVPVAPAPTVEDTALSTVLPTKPSAPRTTWAPLNLPAGMRVVDVSWGSELPGFVAPLAAQRFARVSADGASHDATLWLNVAETDEQTPEFLNGQVHGLQISIVQQPEDIDGVTFVNGWWAEHDLHIQFAATGFSLQEVIDLLDASKWRTDPSEGLEPDSIGSGMSLLFETVGREPRPYTRFIVETESGYVTVEVDDNVRANPDASLEEVPGVGGLFTNIWGTFVLTDDGTLLSLSRSWPMPRSWPNGGVIGLTSDAGLDVARSMAYVDEATVASLSAAAVAREVALPEVGRVTVGDKEVVLRGGTAQLPEALCVVASGSEGCTINHRFPGAEEILLPWTTEWLLAGDGWFFLTYRPNEADAGLPRVCPAGADGSLAQVLDYDQAIVGDRVWTLSSIPDDADFTMLCGWEDPFDPLPDNNIRYIVRRPPS